MSRARPAIHDLFAAAEPPLRYLATASPRRLAPNALPLAHLVDLVDRSLAESGDERLREPLSRLRALFEGFPLDETDLRKGRAQEGLREIERLKGLAQGGEDRSGKRRLAYRRTSGPTGPALELLARPAQFVKGVGPRRAEQLARLGLETVEDVLYHLPFRYEDRRRLVPIAELRAGEPATCVAEIVALGEKRVGRQGRRMLEGLASDASGVLSLAWFHRIPYFAARLKRGQRVVLHGRVETGYGRRRMVHPEIEILEGEEGELGRVVPVYEKPTDMTVGAMRKVVHATLDELGDRIPSVLPPEVASRQGLEDLAAAMREVHAPGGDFSVEEWNVGASAAHRSIVFDELFFLQLGMLMRRRAVAEEPGISFRPGGGLERRLRAALPFRLTGAQERVLGEVGRDMAVPHPMNRLVQGDVGSGKTVVAVLAALRAVESGYQAALMAPTEILAEQHHATVAKWLEPLGIEVALLTGKLGARRRNDVRARVASGEIPFLVGTHALIQEGVAFSRLGLAVVDEQHRFGVLQRKRLQGLGENPDVLLMTATPIPRTL
ncbi:MAG: ATP-dependent DNA helicase RecG [Candidatus Binatia bacterium]